MIREVWFVVFVLIKMWYLIQFSQSCSNLLKLAVLIRLYVHKSIRLMIDFEFKKIMKI